MSLVTRDLAPRIATEVTIDLETLVSGRFARELRELLVARGVLVFRNLQAMTDEQQVRFGSTIGTVRLEHGNTSTRITADRTQSPIFADYTLGTYFYHIDGLYTDTPGFASILRPKVIAPEGGQTEFCNTYALYEDMDPADRALADRLEAVHLVEHTMRMAIPEPTQAQLDHWGAGVNPPHTHPLVWEHETGRRSLLLSSSITHFIGLDPDQGAALLGRLMAMAEDRRYAYTHDWQPGDVLVWDNTGTMHRVIPFDLDCGRTLERVVLLGEERIRGVREVAPA